MCTLFNFLLWWKMKRLVLLILFSLLAGCRENDVKDVNSRNDSASFDYDQVQVVSFETRASDEQWPDLKDTAVVSLRTCLVDAQYVQPIVGEDFQVQSENSNEKPTSNSNGCISWDEKFNFNYIADESFLEVNGTIKGLDNFKGVKSYSVALNPWAKSGFDLEFSRFEKVRDIRAGSMINESVQHLETSSFQATILEKSFTQDNTILKFDIATTPEILRRGIDGNLLREAITGGNFKTEFVIIAKNMSTGNRVIVADATREQSIREDGKLRSAVTFELKSGVDPNSIIELGIRTTALNDKVLLGSDEGIITIKQLDGVMSGELIDIPVPLNLISQQKNQKGLVVNPDNFGFVIDTINIKRGSEVGANLNPNMNESDVVAMIDLRMVDPLIHTDIKNHNYQIDVIDVEDNSTLFTDEKSTNSGSGVVSFRAEIPFRRYNTRRWKDYLVRVRSKQAPYQNIVKERIIHINPWSRAADFGIDSKVGTPPEASEDNTGSIYISEFRYWTESDIPESFQLNKNLDLKFNKQLRLEFNPKIAMSHDFDGGDGIGYPPIVNGKYKVRLLILAPKEPRSFDSSQVIDLNKFKTLTAGETEVTVKQGIVDATIDIPLLFADLMIYSTKNLAVIEMRSMDEEVELKPGYFVGDFVGSIKSGTVKNSESNHKVLSTGNVDIAKTLIAKISSVREKLANIENTPEGKADYFKEFTQRLRTITPKAQVFDHANYRLTQVDSEVEIFDTEIRLKRSKNLKSSVRRISELVDNPVNANQNVLEELCGLMFDKNEKTVELHQYPSGGPSSGIGIANAPVEMVEIGMHYNDCKKRPFDYMDFKKLEHVQEITEQAVNTNTESLNLSRSEAYFMSRGQNFTQMTGVRESDYFQYGWSAGFGIEVGKVLHGSAGFGAMGGTRTDVYTVDQESEVLSKLKRIINQDGSVMPYERYDIQFGAKVKSCVFVTGKRVEIQLPRRYTTHTLFDLFSNKEPARGLIESPKRLYICKRGHEDVSRQESYYFVRTQFTKEGSADMTLIRNSYLNVIRGFKNFEAFRTIQIENDRPLIIHEVEDDGVEKRYKNYINDRGAGLQFKDRIGVGFPGLLE